MRAVWVPYVEMAGCERIVGDLYRPPAGLGGTARTVDIAAALAGMVTHNGGQPLT